MNQFEKDFTVCYELYSKKIKNYLRNFIYNDAIAEDLMQDTFIKLYEIEKNISPELDGVKNLIYKIARNKAIDYLRRKKSELKKLKEVQYDEINLSSKFYNDIENIYFSEEILVTIKDTIDSFPEVKKNIFFDKIILNKNKAVISRENLISCYKVDKIENEIRDKIIKSLDDFPDIKMSYLQLHEY
jgi:RNA polymerase sigma factor (sigma-70 family)